ncbi:MerR family transcriptional regulator [Streptomyces sp. WMMC897]|uniref:MerR family transcriptional regulator n=1 Tax=Streptomyces sp. WMMC897 TaxID=3014782 RepID=UPI0022B74D95|nr:MerR family transcriptional regulator [Streptomyces sp. WMMC897]MCZ7414298.1 MerR family transcriptional regulator [Streptomyces sp. WMMC897]
MDQDLLNGTQAAATATTWRRTIAGSNTPAVTRSAICKWVARGHLTPAGLDAQGRPLYRRADLARAEHATRSRALRHLTTRHSAAS